MRIPPATADRLASVTFFVIGAAMTYGGYAMDRLEIRQIHPASIPGLVPMMLGAALMICAALLYRSARRAPAEEGVPEAAGGSMQDLLAAAGMSLVYALGLVGNIPFVAATAIYIAAFTLYFGRLRDERTGFGFIAFAVTYASVVAVLVAMLFRYGFLVRLP